MSPKETKQQTLARVTRELGAGLRRQARVRWDGVRTAHRNQGRRHVWRFQTSSDGGECYLHVPHKGMVAGTNAAEVLLAQLVEAKWLDRLQDGPEKAFVLSPSGRLQPLSRD